MKADTLNEAATTENVESSQQKSTGEDVKLPAKDEPPVVTKIKTKRKVKRRKKKGPQDGPKHPLTGNLLL